MTIFGTDTSKFNALPDDFFVKAEAEGHGFAILKASNDVGDLNPDPTYLPRVPLLRQTSMIPGSYHYCTSAGSPQQNADLFIRQVEEGGGPYDQVLALDWESKTFGRDDVLRTRDALFTRWGEGILGTYSNPYKWFTVYGNPAPLPGWLWWAGFGYWKTAADGSKYVVSAYRGSTYDKVQPGDWDGALVPPYEGGASLLQYTSTGLVAGLKVDANAFRGTKDDLRKLTYGYAEPAPEPAPSVREALVALRDALGGQPLAGRWKV